MIKKLLFAAFVVVSQVIFVKEISAEMLDTIDLATIEPVVYNGKEQGPRVLYNDKLLVEGVDYICSSVCKDVGTCHTTIYGHDPYVGSADISYEILPKQIVPTLILSTNSIKYSGKKKVPYVAVLDEGKKISDENYEVLYPNASKNVGLYYVIVNLTGNYLGTNAGSYTVIPLGTKIKSLKGGKKKITVKWAKQARKMSTSPITGYEIEYARNKSFSNDEKTIKVKGCKKTGRVVKKLKSKKKYYFRVRTYKTVEGNVLYSKWSKTRAVKAK